MSLFTPLPDSSVVSVSDAHLVLPLLPFVADNLAKFRLYKCHVSDAMISQHEPMKLIYHYEQLDEVIKENLPFQGTLLRDFDKPMTRMVFAQKAGLEIADVAQPWQLKFVGRIVLFCEQPEIALRLHWTNTLKPFAIVAVKDLQQAVEQSFVHWQWIDTVEVISKDPNLCLTAQIDNAPHELPEMGKATSPIPLWQLQASQAFVPLPTSVAVALQQFLLHHPLVKETWLPMLQQVAKEQATAQTSASII